ncbi:YlbF family regulator [Geochorda subterranea]|uniref:YlbF family regulator n=1 Tax=Geochorda subterranea TaxID=3109564 RepID=A0ABZ1BPB6_9FIRM|nr:YlbF family regulator [Limnochorda sp. LNt]WRP14637.1 YlbF family regulator [Limnochorda sp. LNt]
MDQSAQAGIPREISEAIHTLARLLSNLPEVEQLRQAREEIGRHEAARIMLRDLRRRERQLAEKSRRGETPSPQELEELEKVAEVVTYNPYVRALLQAEMAYAGLMAAVVGALEEALQLPALPDEVEGGGVPATPSAGQTGATEGPGGIQPGGRVTLARPKLWVPGQP